MTLVRNDIALTGVKQPITQVWPEAPAEALEAVAGRLLLLRTKPPGGKGDIWHLNFYNATASAPAQARQHLWTCLNKIVEAACQQQAAVVIAGDWNAAFDCTGRRTAGPLKPQDKAFAQLLSTRHGRAAPRAPDDNEYSWVSHTGKAEADLDHIAVFPASIPVSPRRCLAKCDPGLDHCPVMATFPEECMGTFTVAEPSPNYHYPRVATQDHCDNLPRLAAALSSWWSREEALPAPPWTILWN
jgi:exonuclease III